MKCPVCGKEEFYLKRLEGGTDDGWWSSNDVSIAVCLNCGHVQLVASERLLNEVENYKENKKTKDEAKKKIRENETKINEISHQIDEINKEIKEMEDASNNDNILVKDQKELLCKVSVKKNQVHDLKLKISSLKREIDQITKDLNNLINKNGLIR